MTTNTDAVKNDERAALTADGIDWAILEYGKACNEAKSAAVMDAARDRLKAIIAARAASTATATDGEDARAWEVERPDHMNTESWHKVFINGRDALEYASYYPGAKVTPLYTRAAAPQAGLSDEQRTAIKCGAAAIRKVGGFDHFAEVLDEILAEQAAAPMAEETLIDKLITRLEARRYVQRGLLTDAKVNYRAGYNAAIDELTAMLRDHKTETPE